MSRLTKAEYQAQAMLLGMRYGEHTNTMHKSSRDFDPAAKMMEDHYDADTLEKLTEKEWHERVDDWFNRKGERS